MQFIRKQSRSLAVPVTVSAGAAKDCADMKSMHVSVTGTFDATYQVEVSYDGGTSFVAYGSASVDTAFDLALPDAATQVRIRCTEYTSGTPVAAFSGLPLIAGGA